MSMRQVIVLVIAAVAAVGALLLIRTMNSPKLDAAEAPATSAVIGEEVLVAARDIAQGAALTPGDLRVAAFPADAVSEHFIRIEGRPSAQTELVGAVTRRAFGQGEPIIADMVVQPDGRGFMAAMLAPGYRAVAVEIDGANAAGGYIQPNDHVDVILTQKIDGAEGGGDQVRSETVLTDVRVLAVGDKTQPQTSGEAPEQIQAGVAVLELTADGARALGQAQQLGDIALALRAVQVDTVGLSTSDQTRAASQSSGAVRIHAFGVVSGGSR